MRIRYAVHLLLPFLMLAACDSFDLNLPPDPDPDPVPPGLWTVSGEPPQILRLEPTQLSGSGDRSPATVLTATSAGLMTLTGIAFADDGTLWMASPDDSLVLAFAPAGLAASGPTAATTIIAPVHGTLSAPAGLAFDAAHHLWVANHAGGTLVRFDPDQLVTGGPLEPAVTISGFLPHPTGLAFDEAGALWVSDNFTHTLVRYDAGQLMVSGSPAPAAVVIVTPDCFVNPSGLAVDASGNLWVADAGCGTVVAFGPDQLRVSGSHIPRVVLSSADSGFGIPVGLAFDAGGNLWVLGLTGTLTQLSQASLNATGAPAPMARLRLAGHTLLWSLAFWPRPAGLPLR